MQYMIDPAICFTLVSEVVSFPAQSLASVNYRQYYQVYTRHM